MRKKSLREAFAACRIHAVPESSVQHNRTRLPAHDPGVVRVEPRGHAPRSVGFVSSSTSEMAAKRRNFNSYAGHVARIPRQDSYSLDGCAAVRAPVTTPNTGFARRLAHVEHERLVRLRRARSSSAPPQHGTASAAERGKSSKCDKTRIQNFVFFLVGRSWATASSRASDDCKHGGQRLNGGAASRDVGYDGTMEPGSNRRDSTVSLSANRCGLQRPQRGPEHFDGQSGFGMASSPTRNPAPPSRTGNKFPAGSAHYSTEITF